MRIKTNSGFTLVELMVAVILSAIIFGGLYTVLHSANIAWQVESINIDAQNQARLAYDMLARDLRSAEGLNISQTESVISISLSKPNGDDIEYSWTNLGDTANQLSRARTRDGVTTTRLVADAVSTLVFTEDFATGEVMIDVGISINSQNLEEPVGYRLVGKVVQR